MKKGDKSVGVQRQYCGRLGKVENCQVGVFAALGCGVRATLVDSRLYLPESWTADAPRCARAKVPEAERVHRTKPQLALEMVAAARARGSTHRWVGGDEVYGNNRLLTDGLEDMNETFLMDVSSTTNVWESDPCAPTPSAKQKKRTRSRPNASEPITVATLTARCFEREARKVTIRGTTTGPLEAQVWVRQVWVWDQSAPCARSRQLVVREEADGDFKYSLSNAPSATSWERLAYMQAQRFWIERTFEDAKSEVGMAQYEVRSWIGWHHHIALV